MWFADREGYSLTKWKECHSRYSAEAADAGEGFFLAVVFGVVHRQLPGDAVEGNFHRMLKGRTLLQQVIAQNAKCAALRKYDGFFVYGSIFEVKDQSAGDAIAANLLHNVTIGEQFAVQRAKCQKPVYQSFTVKYRGHGVVRTRLTCKDFHGRPKQVACEEE